MTPVEIARQALHRLAELGLPPTPENFEAQVRDIAGLPPREEGQAQPPAPPEPSAVITAKTMDMVRGLLQFMSSTNAELHADLTKFGDQSTSLLAQAGSSRDPKAMAELFEAMTTSSSWLLGQVDKTRKELERTREQLDEVQRELQRVQNEAVSDPLTGLPNRRALDRALSREVARARRNKTPLCVAVIDVDHFKRVNDQYGHAAGDAALVHLVHVLKPQVRGTDMLARFGGEEFALVLPDTSLLGAEFTMNRLMRAIERAPFTFEGKEIAIRFSAGLAEWHSDESPEQIMQRADEAMYRAKAAGRARIVVSESPPPAAP